MYQASPMQDFYRNSTIEVQKGIAVIELPVHEGFFHAGRAVHGSVYFRMLDDAAYFAVSSTVTEHFILTTSFNIELLRPVTNGLLIAHGKLRFTSAKLMVAEATLVDGKGREIAFGTGKFALSKIPLTAEIGYRN